MDGCTFVIVQELDGIFDGDDVADLFLVDAVEKSGESTRLTGAARPGDEHNAFAKVGHFSELRRQAERGQGWNGGRDDPHDDGATAALDENVHAKTGNPR